MKITGETGDRRDADDDLVRFASLVRTEDALNNGRSNLVFDRMLAVRCSRDEELILDVDEVLAITNDLYVRIGNGVLSVQVSTARER